jgi:hypothetical protein
MSKLKHLWPVLFLAVALIVSCSSSDPGSPGDGNGGVPEDPSFADDVQPIFNANCTSQFCHGAGESAGLKLTSGDSYAELVDVTSTNEPPAKRVLADDAENSYLVIKLEGRQSVGGRMPLNAGALSDDDIQTIRNWIDNGAEEN